jgi:cell division ATPase FtsA
VSCTKDTAFEVTESFLDELQVLSKETSEETTKKLSDFGLIIVTQWIAEVRLNDYVVKKPIGKKATEASMTVVQTAVSEKLQDSLEENIKKVLGDIDIEIFSFIDVLYRSLRHLKPHTSEMCVIDITDEASHMAIVRDDVLLHTTHIPFGIATLTRELSVALSVPLGEARGILTLHKTDIAAHYGQKELQNIESVYEVYTQALAQLLLDTSDALMIPQSVFLHTDLHTEPFFTDALNEAIKKVEVLHATILKVGSALFGEVEGDSALFALNYFHNHDLHDELDS